MTIFHCPREKHKTDNDCKIDIHQEQNSFSFPPDLSLLFPYNEPRQQPDGSENHFC
jgi:hypothetical protein